MSDFEKNIAKTEETDDAEMSRKKVVSATGQEAELQLKGVEKKIGIGNYGVIDRVEARFLHPDGRERDIGNFILKTFLSEEKGVAYATEATKKHQYLRAHGFDTWRTVRYVEGEGVIFITDGERDGSLIVAENTSRSLDLFQEKKLDVLEEFSQCVANGLRNVWLADELEAWIPEDAWMMNLHVPLSTAKDIFGKEKKCISGSQGLMKRVFIGDLDEINDKKVREYKGMTNLEQFRFYMEFMIQALLNPASHDRYFRILEETIEKELEKRR